MSRLNLCRLLSLAALWGASFLFMRIGAATLPPPLLMFLRVAIAAGFLLIVMGPPRALRPHLALGLLNSALPFLLLGFAARQLPAGTLATINALSPAFAVLVTGVVERRMPASRVFVGLVLGVLGVAVAVGAQPTDLSALCASLGAAACYGCAATLAKRRTASNLPRCAPGEMACGSMLAAAIFLALPAALSCDLAVLDSVPMTTWLSVLALGVACTGLAYLLYFPLVAECGATAALSVTFLVPLFAVGWAALLLAEPIHGETVVGGALVLLGTALTTGVMPSWRTEARAL
jgi:drug/metabolite transporter (DMT)-like permease